MASVALTSSWGAQADWSAAATRLKRQIDRRRASALACIAVAVVTQTAAARLEAANVTGAEWVASIGAALLALAALLRGVDYRGQQTADWIGCRSISEALKSEIYMYLTGTNAYRCAGPERDAELIQAVARVRERGASLLPQLRDAEVGKSSPSSSLTLKEYLDQRVEGQIQGYYRPTAARLVVRRRRFKQLELALTGSAAVLGAVAAQFQSTELSAWVAPLSAVVAALVAHIDGARLEQLIISYRATAYRLEDIVNRWQAQAPDLVERSELQDALVRECEAALSEERDAWAAALRTKPSGASGGR